MDYANTLAEQGDFSHAAQVYQKLIQSHPNMWDAFFNLGYMYYQAGQSESAVLTLSKAAAGDPTNAGAVFYLGLADFKLNRLGEAEANLRRAIVLAPASPNYHFALGMVLKFRGNWSGAMAEFSKELELNPQHQPAAQQTAEIKRQALEK
jgi:Flp pilus assembly protein TadD